MNATTEYKYKVMSLDEILEYISKVGCSYYDYTRFTRPEWQNRLETSEVNNYTKVTDNIYINNCDHCYAIHKYDDGAVYVWIIRRIID